MAAVNRTLDFREVLEQRQHALPRGKRHKISRTTSGPNYSQITSGKEYITEAYAIVRGSSYLGRGPRRPTHVFGVQLEHINTLTRMLANIRKPYLNVDARSAPISRQSSGHVDFSASDQSWSGIRHLTSEERDQIDTQARVILTRCAERVKEMEALEKRAVLFPFRSLTIRPETAHSFIHSSRTCRNRFEQVEYAYEMATRAVGA
jgi:syntaxin 18